MQKFGCPGSIEPFFRPIAAFVLAGALSSAGCSSTGDTQGGQGGGGVVIGFGGAASSAHGGATSAAAGADDNEAGAPASASGGKGGASSGTSGGTTSGSTQCNNGIDDDGDGLVDGFDPECTGSADNDEGSYATGIPGDNRDPKWQDCFFDGNSGAGDDRCRYPTGCLDGSIASDDSRCALAQACIDFCRPLTPNGCDCFGCCTVRLPSGQDIDIELSGRCSLANANDPSACTPCTKSTDCSNNCGECELCAGKTAADLPASCTPSEPPPSDPPPPGEEPPPPPPSYTCDSGEAVCGPGLPECPPDQYCSLGCCLMQVR